MQYQASQQTRRLIGRLDQGEELLEAIEGLCRKEKIQAAQLRATGALKQVELVRFDAASREYVTVAQGAASAEVITLTGSVSTLGGQLAIRIDGVLLANAPFGPQLMAGQLKSGVVEALEFVIEEFVDVELTRKLDGATGRLLLEAVARAGVAPAAVAAPVTPAQPAAQPAAPVVVNRAVSVSQPAFAREQAPAPKPAPVAERPAPVAERPAVQAAAPTPTPAPTPAPKPAQQAMSWQEAAQAAQETRPAPATAGGPPPKPGEEPDFKAGDWLDHPTLGRCQIMRVEDDETVHVRMRGGKVGKLVLESFEILFDGDEGGRNVFKLRKNRERD